MRAPRRVEFDHLPENGVGAFLYVAEFSDGVVKLGRSLNPRQRIIQIAGDCRRFGAPSVTRCDAFQVPHGHGPEQRALALIARIGSVEPNRREYFSGVRYEAALAIAREVASCDVHGPQFCPAEPLNTTQQISGVL